MTLLGMALSLSADGADGGGHDSLDGIDLVESRVLQKTQAGQTEESVEDIDHIAGPVGNTTPDGILGTVSEAWRSAGGRCVPGT